MWKVKYISCENFLSFQTAELDIPQNSCTLIYGLNNDNAMQRNNGTGKSSIIEAIAFALTGEPLRAVDNVGEIINDNSDNANVYIELANDFDNTEFTIERKLDRKAPQVIECHKYKGDDEIETDKTIQPTVLDYNRYILDEIGLTKEDIYSCFILSNNRYSSFFDASDKNKKAMINRFSGADIVDVSIEALDKDISPLEQQVTQAKEAKIAIEAKIEVVNEQLANADQKKAQWESERNEKIATLKQSIGIRREEMRDFQTQIKDIDKRLDMIDEAGEKVERILDAKKSLLDTYSGIAALFKQYELQPVKNYVEMAQNTEQKLSQLAKDKKQCEGKLSELKVVSMQAQKTHLEVQKRVDDFKQKVADTDKKSNDFIADIDLKLADLKKMRDKVDTDIRNINKEIDNTNKAIAELNNILHGVIVCPNCKHEFFLSKDSTPEETRKELKENNKLIGKLQEQCEKLDDKLTEFNDEQKGLERDKANEREKICQREEELAALTKELRKALKAMQEASSDVELTNLNLSTMSTAIQMEESRLDALQKSMEDEAINIINTALDNGELTQQKLKDKIAAIKGSIDALNDSITQVSDATQEDYTESLNKSKAEYCRLLDTRTEEYGKVLEEYNVLILQKNYFTEFRSYLANKKLEAIASVTNHFLQLIGSDLSVEMQGFKKLKNGKIRDKITVNLIRNGVPCGSYARHSGGERARVNLASILGLQRLMNSSAPSGKGLELLVIDEVLESEDQIGIESTCEALNTLKITSLLVTQNPVVDTTSKVITVVKENGYSTISNV